MSLPATDVVRSAFLLARSGRFDNLDRLERALSKSGFTAGEVETYLHGKSIRKELRDLCKACCASQAVVPQQQQTAEPIPGSKPTNAD